MHIPGVSFHLTSIKDIKTIPHRHAHRPTPSRKLLIWESRPCDAIVVSWVRIFCGWFWFLHEQVRQECIYNEERKYSQEVGRVKEIPFKYSYGSAWLQLFVTFLTTSRILYNVFWLMHPLSQLLAGPSLFLLHPSFFVLSLSFSLNISPIYAAHIFLICSLLLECG